MYVCITAQRATSSDAPEIKSPTHSERKHTGQSLARVSLPRSASGGFPHPRPSHPGAYARTAQGPKAMAITTPHAPLAASFAHRTRSQRTCRPTAERVACLHMRGLGASRDLVRLLDTRERRRAEPARGGKS